MEFDPHGYGIPIGGQKPILEITQGTAEEYRQLATNHIQTSVDAALDIVYSVIDKQAQSGLFTATVSLKKELSTASIISAVTQVLKSKNFGVSGINFDSFKGSGYTMNITW